MAEKLEIKDLNEISGGNGGKVEPRYIHYVVREHDTLASIAKKYRVELRELMHANYISNANILHAGTELLIPNVNRK